MQLISKHPAETVAIGDAIAQSARGGDVIALMGELGAGKTQLVRGLARGLGLDAQRVSSPTFVLMHEYEPPEAPPEVPPVRRTSDGGSLTLVHIDAYRVGSLGDLESLGWANDPDLRRNTLVAVEWADRLGDSLGEDVLTVRLAHAGDEARRLVLSPGGAWRPRWGDLAAALDTFIEQAPQSLCPICKRPVREDESTFPFCSKRCRTIDLGRWIDGRYTISRPVEQSDLEEGD